MLLVFESIVLWDQENPNDAVVLHNLGVALTEEGRVDGFFFIFFHTCRGLDVVCCCYFFPTVLQVYLDFTQNVWNHNLRMKTQLWDK